MKRKKPDQNPSQDVGAQPIDPTKAHFEVLESPRPDLPVGRPKRAASQGKLLDETARREIIAIISVGCSAATAAKYVGCSPTAITLLKKRCAEFQEAFFQAEARHELVLVRRIHEATTGKGGWHAAAWLLARSYPERYAARGAETVTPRQVAQSMEYFATVIAREVPDAKLRLRLRSVLRRAVAKVAGDIRKRVEK